MAKELPWRFFSLRAPCRAPSSGADEARLTELAYRRLQGPVVLSDAAAEELVWAVARQARYRTAPEGIGRARLGALVLKRFGEGLTSEERTEYLALTVAYPYRPDPADPLGPAIERFRALAEGRRPDGDGEELPSSGLT